MNPNFELLVQKAELTPPEMEELRAAIDAEYPSDPMMQEIRLVRCLHVLADKRLVFSELLAELRAELSESAGPASRLATA